MQSRVLWPRECPSCRWRLRGAQEVGGCSSGLPRRWLRRNESRLRRCDRTGSRRHSRWTRVVPAATCGPPPPVPGCGLTAGLALWSQPCKLVSPLKWCFKPWRSFLCQHQLIIWPRNMRVYQKDTLFMRFLYVCMEAVSAVKLADHRDKSLLLVNFIYWNEHFKNSCALSIFVLNILIVILEVCFVWMCSN